MADLLAQGAAWLDGQRHRYLTQTVTYRRGESAVQVQATIGRTVFRLNDAYGATVRHISRDYLIRAADLVLNGERVEPKRGDLVIETDDAGIEHTHEVMGPGASGGGPDWRYSDPQRLVLRIHNKEIGTP